MTFHIVVGVILIFAIAITIQWIAGTMREKVPKITMHIPRTFEFYKDNCNIKIDGFLTETGKIVEESIAIRTHNLISDTKLKAFLREIINDIYYILGESYEDKSEKEVDELAGAIFALAVDNPDLFGKMEG